MKIAVLGAGGWGTTLAILLYQNGHHVTLWEYNKEYTETLIEYRENFYYLPKIKIPRKITITNDIELAVSDSMVIVSATPTQFIRNNFLPLKNFDFGNKIVLSVSKGIENGTLMFVSEILNDIFKKVKKENIACLSGPSHAEEVSRKVPTAVVCACEKLGIAKIVQNLFSNNYFRVYSSPDLKGTEIGGALKNVIAIAAGISDGAGFGDNTKAALMTRGINEIMRLGILMKAHRETFFGLSGIGDLVVTCDSKHSRNRFVGEEIGKGKKLKTILNDMKMVAEGIATSKSAYQLTKLHKIELPIVEQVYEILFKGKSPRTATELLMTRSLKKENEI